LAVASQRFHSALLPGSDAVLINRRTASKVPEVTVYFWVIKILSTTVGETIADTLNVDFDLGLAGTSVLMAVGLAVVMAAQFAVRRYVPAIYWLAVVLVSVVGTLITDLLTDKLQVALEATTVVFTAALIMVFVIWYAIEHTLSIHSIVTVRREAFYWLAVLFTFAVGTAGGDLVAERFGLGYLGSALIVAAIISAVAALHYGVNLDAVLAFWIAYVLTRPLGASLGDLLSQDREAGGVELGATVTSVIFGVVIVALVVYLTLMQVDQIRTPVDEPAGRDIEPAMARRAPDCADPAALPVDFSAPSQPRASTLGR
jgi:uncharacterized membrane-anchored protein